MSGRITAGPEQDAALERRKLRTALVLGLIALSFFLGFIAKMWLQQ